MHTPTRTQLDRQCHLRGIAPASGREVEHMECDLGGWGVYQLHGRGPGTKGQGPRTGGHEVRIKDHGQGPIAKYQDDVGDCDDNMFTTDPRKGLSTHPGWPLLCVMMIMMKMIALIVVRVLFCKDSYSEDIKLIGATRAECGSHFCFRTDRLPLKQE